MTFDQSPKLIDTMDAQQPTKTGGLLSLIAGLFKFVTISAILGLIVAVGFLIGGFLKYTDTVTSYKFANQLEKASAIAVYTGGDSRIAEAVKLLKDGKGQRLLISGVYPETTRKILKSEFHIDQKLLDCCIDIDNRAPNTEGNAIETGKWSVAHKFESLIIVTSSYHMPRSILETRRQLSDTRIIPYPVATMDFDRENWYKDRKSLYLLLSEYSKYVATQIRPVLSEGALKSIQARMTSF